MPWLPAQGRAAVGPIAQNFPAVVKQLQELTSRMESVMGDLQATPVYNARKSFACGSCGAHGQVAVPVLCTQCGKQTWWGWWPQKR